MEEAQQMFLASTQMDKVQGVLVEILSNCLKLGTLKDTAGPSPRHPEDVDGGHNATSSSQNDGLLKFTTLIIASATKAKTGALCGKLFQKAKEAIEMDMDPIHHSGSEDQNVNSSEIVQNPIGLREKRQKNKRKVSIAKKKSNQVKAKKKNAVR